MLCGCHLKHTMQPHVGNILLSSSKNHGSAFTLVTFTTNWRSVQTVVVLAQTKLNPGLSPCSGFASQSSKGTSMRKLPEATLEKFVVLRLVLALCDLVYGKQLME